MPCPCCAWRTPTAWSPPANRNGVIYGLRKGGVYGQNLFNTMKVIRDGCITLHTKDYQFCKSNLPHPNWIGSKEDHHLNTHSFPNCTSTLNNPEIFFLGHQKLGIYWENQSLRSETDLYISDSNITVPA